MPVGQIKAARVTGSVKLRINDQVTSLASGDLVPEAATVVTEKDSSVVLVFSNGATTQLGAETELSIQEYRQAPLSQQYNLADAEEEPTTSRTSLDLKKGELVGVVKKLKQGRSRFIVNTPVGAAGVRGTTFRIVFRPSGTGQAFAVFSLSTVEGNVNFQSGAQQGPQQPAPGTPAAGVAVTDAQEIVVTVSVQVDPQSGAVTVTEPPTVTSTQPISPATNAAIVQQAQEAASTAATQTFTPPAGGEGNPSPTPQQGEGEDSPDDATTPDEGTSGDGGAAGQGGGDGAGSGSSANAGAGGAGGSGAGGGDGSPGAPNNPANDGGNNTPNNPNLPTAPADPTPPPTPPPRPSPVPPVVQPLPPLTPGAGKE